MGRLNNSLKLERYVVFMVEGSKDNVNVKEDLKDGKVKPIKSNMKPKSFNDSYRDQIKNAIYEIFKKRKGV